MNLRQKTLLLTTLPLLGLVIILYGSLSTILQRSYGRLEQQSAQRNLQRVEEVLASDLEQLRILTEDWAAWNDTYTFIDGQNPDYFDSNLAHNSLASLELNMMIFVNAEGEIIYGDGYDLEAETPVEIPPSLQQQLASDRLLLQFSSIADFHTGLLPVGDQVLLVAVEPILRSDDTGPARGAVLMGRYLDAAKIDDIALRTRLDLDVYRLAEAQLPEALEPLLTTIQAQEHDDNAVASLIQPLDANYLAGYALLPDLYGQPQILVQITLPRDIYRQGQLSLHYLGLALLGACVFFTLSMLLLLERAILRRLMGLSTDVQDIGRTNDLTQRVHVQGDDELSRLGQRINAMLGELQISNEKLAEEQQRAERLLLNILPAPIADELMHDLSSVPKHFDEVTILFADLVGFTPMSKRLSPIDLVNLLNRIFSAFDDLAEQLGLEKIKTIGDAYMVAAGLPLLREDHSEAVAEMALAMQAVPAMIQAEFEETLQIRIGINTGVVVAGVIGTKKFIYDLWGDAVNVASRMESSSQPGMIQVTAATYERLKDQYILEKRGLVAVKGRGEMETYWLKGHLTDERCCRVPIVARNLGH